MISLFYPTLPLPLNEDNGCLTPRTQAPCESHSCLPLWRCQFSLLLRYSFSSLHSPAPLTFLYPIQSSYVSITWEAPHPNPTLVTAPLLPPRVQPASLGLGPSQGRAQQVSQVALLEMQLSPQTQLPPQIRHPSMRPLLPLSLVQTVTVPTVAHQVQEHLRPVVYMVHRMATSLARKQFGALECLGWSGSPSGGLWSLFDPSLVRCLVRVYSMRYTSWDFFGLYLTGLLDSFGLY